MTTLVYLPRVSVRQDARLVMDARTAKSVTAAVDRKDARVLNGIVRVTQKIGSEVVDPVAILEIPNGYITPTGDAAGLTVRTEATLTKNGTTAGSSSYRLWADAQPIRCAEPVPGTCAVGSVPPDCHPVRHPTFAWNTLAGDCSFEPRPSNPVSCDSRLLGERWWRSCQGCSPPRGFRAASLCRRG